MSKRCEICGDLLRLHRLLLSKPRKDDSFAMQARKFRVQKAHGKHPMYDPVTIALKKILPATCLPGGYKTHQEFADALVVALSGDFALVPRGKYDAMVSKIRRYDQLRKNLPVTKDPIEIVKAYQELLKG